MLSIYSLLCFATFFSFFNATSTLPSNSPVPHVNLSRTLQKSSLYCDTDCSISLGADSTCVDGVCVCDIGYKKDRRSPDTFACMRIDCQFDSDCPQDNTECSYGSCSCKSGYRKDFKRASCTDSCQYNYQCTDSHTKCDSYLSKCVCEDGYKKESSGCVKDGCTYDSDCPVMNMHCDSSIKECVCDDGYMSNFGSCTYIYTPNRGSSGSGSGIGIGAGGLVIVAVVCFILRLLCRNQKKSTRRVAPVNGRTQQQMAATVPSVPQAELRIPVGYQAGYQPQAPMFPEPYGNLQDTPPPPYSETYSPPAFQVAQPHPLQAIQPPTDQQPSAPKI